MIPIQTGQNGRFYYIQAGNNHPFWQLSYVARLSTLWQKERIRRVYTVGTVMLVITRFTGGRSKSLLFPGWDIPLYPLVLRGFGLFLTRSDSS